MPKEAHTTLHVLTNERHALAALLRSGLSADIFADLDEESEPGLHRAREEFEKAVQRAAELLEAPALRYVSAETQDGDNVNLLVRAATDLEAQDIWRAYYVDWDLSNLPKKIAEIPAFGEPGAVNWNDING